MASHFLLVINLFRETHVLRVNRQGVFLKHKIVHLGGTVVNEHKGSPAIFDILYLRDLISSLCLDFGTHDLSHYKMNFS